MTVEELVGSLHRLIDSGDVSPASTVLLDGPGLPVLQWADPAMSGLAALDGRGHAYVVLGSKISDVGSTHGL